MNKIVIRFPFTIDMGCNIFYLEKLAEKGWRLKKVNSFFYVFEKIKPEKLFYYIYNLKNDEENDTANQENQINMKFLCKHSNSHYYCCNNNDIVISEKLNNETILELKIHAIILSIIGMFCFPAMYLLGLPNLPNGNIVTIIYMTIILLIGINKLLSLNLYLYWLKRSKWREKLKLYYSTTIILEKAAFGLLLVSILIVSILR